ncbi:hypothetical protein R3Q08_31690 [Rhodococcus erythropolis]|uniref:hypothetical protein n=1 Tax=Rhodococcus erythropolis TaxID=1833 RepID=UPI002948FD90|nr:hypothetical protein [Rhodococcus erythropolis]MDV6212814.1 hypothetical protein [Rhodococcus erythropolis]
MPDDLTSEYSGIADAREHLREVRDRGVAWLLERIGDDGRPAHADEHHGYYRFPWTLAYVGERERAAAVMSWIERKTLTDDGDLRDGVARAAWTTDAATYPLTIIAQGAWVLESFDTANAVMETLRRDFVDPVTGGAYRERPEARATGYQMSFATAQLGSTALTTGQTDLADGAFAFFQRVMAAQPDLPGTLYPVWGREGLVTEFDETYHYNALIDFSKPMQAFHNPGIAAGFLARYSQMHGNAEAKALASALIALNEQGTAEQFNYAESSGICKLGLGSAMLLDIDPDPRLVRNIKRMIRWYADAQRPDGAWIHRTPNRPENPPEAFVMEKTAEHVLWLSMMLTSLARYEASMHGETAIVNQLQGRPVSSGTLNKEI